MPREFAFCEQAIRQPAAVLVASDATRDARFAHNPLVTDDPHIRFCAGAPLVSAAGHAVGTICIVDSEPRELDAKQIETLQFLAAQVMERLEERARAGEGQRAD